ncbi:S1-like domain-containing RNA-binding protein [Helicobacter himalayensis]|uniref:S1-like domain-containing RNA-binding protein n=1 Tax=Helicobacter himalayensis TaxID=1591088 RepID=UPI0008341D80|nr:S1-like domain-containing RNA-binding protein [Helicobacter himalayensis]
MIQPKARLQKARDMQKNRANQKSQQSALQTFVGKICELEVARLSPYGAFLSLPQDTQKQSEESVLLPKKFVLDTLTVGDKVRVFLYTDSEDRLVASTQTPLLCVGEVGMLRVVDITSNGYFVDLGVDKELFVPSKMPKNKNLGKLLTIFLSIDKQGRLIGRLGIKERLQACTDKRLIGANASAFVFEKTPLGFGCVVAGRHYGLLYHNELAFVPKLGEILRVKVKRLRSDGKLDLSPVRAISGNCLLDLLKMHNGRIELDFKTSPEEIVRILKMSKKNFKLLANKLVRENLAEFIDAGDARKALVLKNV